MPIDSNNEILSSMFEIIATSFCVEHCVFQANDDVVFHNLFVFVLNYLYIPSAW